MNHVLLGLVSGVLGGFMLISGAAKAINLHPFYHYMNGLSPFSELPREVVWSLSVAVVFVEIGIGLALIAQVQRASTAKSLAVLVTLFTLVVAPSYAEKGCGCGWIADAITPNSTAGFIGRNVGIVALSLFLIRSREVPVHHRNRLVSIAASISVLAVGLYAYGGAQGSEGELAASSVRAGFNGEPQPEGAQELVAPGTDGSADAARVTVSPTGVRPIRGEKDKDADFIVVGAVRGVEGGPLPGIQVCAVDQPDTVVSVSGPDGRFIFTSPDESYELTIRSDDYLALNHAQVSAGSESVQLVIIAAARGRIDGVVQGIDRRPIDDVRVWRRPLRPSKIFGLGAGVRTELLTGLERSDPEGRFAIDVPLLPGVFEVAFQADGYVEQSIAIESVSRSGVLVVMSPLASEGHLAGLVVDDRGGAVSGATLSIDGDAFAVSDDAGQFAIDGALDNMEAIFAAAAPGFAPWSEPVGVLLAEQGPESVVVELSSSAASIKGRIIEEGGKPLGGWVVRLTNGTAIDTRVVPPQLAENLSSGAAATKSSNDGVFTIEGVLPDRPYTAVVYEEESGFCRELAELYASSRPIVVEVPAERSAEGIRIRVVDGGGEPVRGVELALEVGALTSTGWWVLEREALGVTPEGGVLDADRWPLQGAYVRVSGPSIAGLARSLTASEIESGEATVEVERNFVVRLVVNRDGVSQLAALDESGAHCLITMAGGFASPFIDVEVGELCEIILPQSVRRLQLLADGEGIDEVALDDAAREGGLLRVD